MWRVLWCGLQVDSCVLAMPCTVSILDMRGTFIDFNAESFYLGVRYSDITS